MVNGHLRGQKKNNTSHSDTGQLLTIPDVSDVPQARPDSTIRIQTTSACKFQHSVIHLMLFFLQISDEENKNPAFEIYMS